MFNRENGRFSGTPEFNVKTIFLTRAFALGVADGFIVGGKRERERERERERAAVAQFTKFKWWVIGMRTTTGDTVRLLAVKSIGKNFLNTGYHNQ